jgi:glycosyltransferase involved in cell wall biosynthesis
MPSVSVIMNCYNGEKYLREAIDSIYAQTFTDWEIILWDDDSTDGTGEIARSYDEKLRYFKGKKAVSLGQARNWAMEKARGEFIAFLDQDDLWMPEKLEKQIPLFHTDDEIGIVISDTYFFNDNEDIVKQLYLKKKPPTGFVFKELLKSYFISLETAIIRRKSLESLTYWFDERFTMIEEADFFRRISYTWKLAMVNKPLAKWRVHPESWTWKHPHFLVDETRLMLTKYRETIPAFNEKFSQEIQILERKLTINEALNFLNSGNGNEARICLSPYICLDPKVHILFLLSYLPNTLFSFIYRLRNGLAK